MFGNPMSTLLTYNLETVIAEKLEAILSKGDTNGRLKNYYDIYLLTALHKEDINMDHLRQAISKTFEYRNFNVDIDEALKGIANSELLKTKWKAYQRRNKYAVNINYDDIIDKLKELAADTLLIAI